MRVNKIVSFSVVILLIAVLFAGAVPAAAAQTDTMQFRYNAQHSGDYSPVAGPVPSDGKLKWSFTTGDSVSSSPAVANGVVYVGGWNNKLYALNATTGTLVWTYTTGFVVRSSPAVVNGVVYVGSCDGKLYALNALTGKLKWSFTTGDQVESSPAVANGVVYVGSDDGKLYALDTATGTLKWAFTTGNHTESSPAVANGVVYVGSDDGNIYALYAKNGTKLWNRTIGAYVESSPAVANGVVYVGGGANVYALDSVTGKLKWTFPTRGLILCSPAVANGVVYIGSWDHNVYAINAATGELNWSFWTGWHVMSPPAVANGVVYVGSEDNYMYAFNATNGTILWNFKTGHDVDSGPAVANGVVYFGSYDDNIYAIGSQPTPTHIVLTASTTTPAVYQPITLTAKLYWWNYTTSQWAPVSAGKPVTVYHYLNGVRYTDKTTYTDSSGKVTFTQSFGSPGKRTYYATFAGDTSYKASTSSVLNVNVKAPIRVTLAASTTTPAVNQKVTFTGKLYWWNSATNQWALITTGKPVTIYHYLNGVKYTDTTKTTDGNGRVTLSQSFSSAGQRTYYATFAGDTWYKASTSAVVTIRVH